MLRILISMVLSLVVGCAIAADPPTPGAIDGLRAAYPSGSIDSTARADAALASTSGTKAEVEKDYKSSARDCLKTVLVNDCLDRARGVRRRRMTDIDAVELEANRFKRRERADQVEAGRKLRESERNAKAPDDAALRARNRESFDAKKVQAAKDAAAQARSRSIHSASKPHRPVVKVPQSSSATSAEQREKNAKDYTAKVKEAKEHAGVIARRVASKDADRKRRAEAKAAKEAKAAAATHGTAGPPAPPVSAPKP